MSAIVDQSNSPYEKMDGSSVQNAAKNSDLGVCCALTHKGTKCKKRGINLRQYKDGYTYVSCAMHMPAWKFTPHRGQDEKET